MNECCILIKQATSKIIVNFFLLSPRTVTSFFSELAGSFQPIDGKVIFMEVFQKTQNQNNDLFLGTSKLYFTEMTGFLFYFPSPTKKSPATRRRYGLLGGRRISSNPARRQTSPPTHQSHCITHPIS